MLYPTQECYDTNSTRECSLMGFWVEDQDGKVVSIPRLGSRGKAGKMIGRN